MRRRFRPPESRVEPSGPASGRTERIAPADHVSRAAVLAVASLILLCPGARPSVEATPSDDASPAFARTGTSGPSRAAVAAPTSSAPSFREVFDGLWRRRWKIRELADDGSTYGIVVDGGDPVLEVESRGSATMIWRPVTGASDGDGWISWRWKVGSSNLPMNRDTRRRSGDDYAARVFVLFGDPGDEGDSPDADPLDADSRALCYVWADDHPVGSIYPSPYVDRVVTIVLQSGSVGEDDGWARERRNLESDYRTAFGDSAPPVTAVALMVDSDDTGTAATARFDDVALQLTNIR